MVERVVREGERLGRRLNKVDRVESAPRDRQHLRALVHAGDVEPAPQQLGGDHPGAGRDIEDVTTLLRLLW